MYNIKNWVAMANRHPQADRHLSAQKWAIGSEQKFCIGFSSGSQGHKYLHFPNWPHMICDPHLMDFHWVGVAEMGVPPGCHGNHKCEWETKFSKVKKNEKPSEWVFQTYSPGGFRAKKTPEVIGQRSKYCKILCRFFFWRLTIQNKHIIGPNICQKKI